MVTWKCGRGGNNRPPTLAIHLKYRPLGTAFFPSIDVVAAAVKEQFTNAGIHWSSSSSSSASSASSIALLLSFYLSLVQKVSVKSWLCFLWIFSLPGIVIRVYVCIKKLWRIIYYIIFILYRIGIVGLDGLDSPLVGIVAMFRWPLDSCEIQIPIVHQ